MLILLIIFGVVLFNIFFLISCCLISGKERSSEERELENLTKENDKSLKDDTNEEFYDNGK